MPDSLDQPHPTGKSHTGSSGPFIAVIGGTNSRAKALAREFPDFQLTHMSDFEEESVAIAAGADAVLFDLCTARLPTPERLASLFLLVRARSPALRPVALVAGDDVERARAVLGAGAWDVILETDDPRRIAKILSSAAAHHRLVRASSTTAVEASERANVSGRDEGTSAALGSRESALVGRSPEMLRLFGLIRRLAEVDLPILVVGETGVGKERVAEAIHQRSLRASGPFVPVNCSAIPETLLESELFGVDAGAFTGATRSRTGRFEAANGGSLFLDEIGEMNLASQVKLLRFLEDHHVERLGGERRIEVDVRIIAATDRELSEAVESGGFREDLLYRLNAFSLYVPPLRERGGDVIELARTFLEREARRVGRDLRGFTPEATAALFRWRWPGNVRELENRIRRAVVAAEATQVSEADLELEGVGDLAEQTLRDARSTAEQEALEAALRRTGWNKSEAARLLEVSRTQLYELMDRHGMGERPKPRGPEKRK